MPGILNPNSLPPDSGSWFSGLGNIFSWGGGNDPPPMPSFNAPGSGTQTPWGGQQLPPPNVSRMPPVPQGSGTETAWGGPEVMTNAAAAPEVAPSGSGTYGTMPEGTKSYSFMDNPGASDALVAFGAAMLKAPDFNTGLGDAALAVNQVAQKYRMPTEADYARAKQLGIIRNIANGGSYLTGADGQGGIQVDQKTMYYAPDGRVLWAATDSNGNPGVWDASSNQFIPGGVPGMQDRRDSAIGSINRYGIKADSEAEQQLYTEAMAANDNLILLDQLQAIRPTAGVGMDAQTRIARELVRLTGGAFGDIDPTSVSTLDASVKQIGLNWSQKMRGQGQVTENERKMIAEMLPQALMDPTAFDRLTGLLRQIEQRKQQMAQEWFSNQAALRQQYGSFRGFMLSRVQELAIVHETGSNSGSKPASSDGGRKSLNDIFGP